MPTTFWNDPTTVGAAYLYNTPQVATLADGTFVVVWTTGTDLASRNIVYQVFDQAGQPTTEIALVETSTSPTFAPTVYATPTGFAIVTTRDFAGTGDDDARLYSFSSDGSYLTETLVANSSDDEVEATGVFNYRYVTAFIANGEVNVVSYDANLANRVEATIVMAGNEGSVRVGALPSGSTLVTWTNANSGVMAQVVGSDGALSGAPFTVSASAPFVSASPEGVVGLQTGYAVSYAVSSIFSFSGPSHYVQLYDNSNVAIGSAVYIASNRPGGMLDCEVIKSGSGFLAVYTTGYSQFGTSNLEISGQFYDGQGRQVGNEFYIATGGEQTDPDIAVLADGRIIVTYLDNGQTTFQIMDPRDGVVDGTASQDRLYGSNLENDQIIGANGNDFLYGLNGNDRLDGGKGADRMDGGRGDDTYIVDNAADVVIEAANAGYDTVRSSVTFNASVAALAAIEEIVLTGAGAISATGNALDNVLTGNIGANILDGKGGADIMSGGSGGDIYYVDNVSDVVIEASSTAPGTDIIYSSVSYTLSGRYVETLTLTGVDAINATGNTAANTLIGNAGANVLDGGGGADVMTGNDGNDTYYVNHIGDVVNEASTTGGTDIIFSSVTYNLSGRYVETLTLTGAGAINATGNSAANVLNGNTGANALSGGGGADRLNGGLGADTLLGGADNDVFVYTAIAESSTSVFDRIGDLTAGDKIDLSAIDANTIAGGNQAFAIVNAFTNVAGQMTLKYAAGTNLTTILMDVNGDGVADMKITATGDHHAFTNFVF